MKIGRWSIALLGLLGVMTFLVACSQPTLTAATMAEMSWWDHVKRSLVQNNFLGYVIPLLIAVAGLVFRLRMLRFAILVFAIVYLGFVLGLRFSGLGAPSTFIMFLNETGIKVNMSFYLTWAFLIVLGLFVGRLFCGWVCPMGAFQQLLFRKDMAVKVSQRVHEWLVWLRFAVLVAIIITVSVWGARYWGPNDPFRILFRLNFEWSSIVGTILLVLVLAASLFVFVPWCKYVCPLGAALAIFSKLSLWKVKVDEATCTNCKRCYKVDCDYQAITPGDGNQKPRVNQLQCTTCGECIAGCPEAALRMTWSMARVKQTESTARVTGPAGREPGTA